MREGGRVQVAAISASREQRLTPGCGLFELEAFVLVDVGPFNLRSVWPVRGTLQHPDFGIVLEGEAAENHDTYTLGIRRSFHLLQLLRHLINSKKELPAVFAEFHLVVITLTLRVRDKQ